MADLVCLSGLLALLASLPGTLYLLLLSLAALLPRRQPVVAAGETGLLALIVPAHNEAASIKRTVASLSAECQRDGRCALWVVADNCEDDTAELAAAAGAKVLVRQNPQLRGKGFALDHAFQALAGHGYAWFIVIDADSTVDAGFLATLRQAMQPGQDALQACYLSRPAHQLRARLARFAQFGFNLVRPLGRNRLGASAGLLGNGFALRASLLKRLPYQARSVVEDLEYHLDLCAHGVHVRFVPRARVWGEIAESARGARQQRTRWEGGRLRLARERIPMLLRRCLRGEWSLIDPVAELLLAPLGLHLPLMLLALAAPAAAGRLALLGPLALGLYLLAIFHRTPACRSDWLALAATPVYLLWKLSLLPATLARSRSQAAWERAERNMETGAPK